MTSCGNLYAVMIEYFLLPLRINAERKMNEEMDLGEYEKAWVPGRNEFRKLFP